jgi:hypothetical protein
MPHQVSIQSSINFHSPDKNCEVKSLMIPQKKSAALAIPQNQAGGHQSQVSVLFSA